MKNIHEIIFLLDMIVGIEVEKVFQIVKESANENVRVSVE